MCLPLLLSVLTPTRGLLPARDAGPAPSDRARVTRVSSRGAEAVTRAWRMGKPTVYYYFSDKSALFTEVVCSVLEEHGAGLKTAARRGGRARERLVSALAYLVGARCSGPRLLREGGVSLTVDQTSQARSAFFRHFFSPLQRSEERRVGKECRCECVMRLSDLGR